MKLFVVVLWALTVVAAAQAPAPAGREKHPPAVAVDAQQEAQALTQDIARMRSLLQQMEMNLAFVTTTQNPLKHQFELEMDMWRVVLDGMERRVQRIQARTQK
jgi:GTP1/Obg family GTP-binding protein